MKRKIWVGSVTICLVLVGVPALAKVDLKTAGEKCKKNGSVAAAADGHELTCTNKKWVTTPNTIPEKDMPGGKPNPGTLYAARVDQQKEDQEAKVGSPVRLTGRTAWVQSAKITGKLLTIQVRILNRDTKAKPYNTLDWRMQTPNGQVVDPTYFSGKVIETGDLVPGGFVEGAVRFDITGKGPFFVIYKPDPFNSARGIWQVG